MFFVSISLISALIFIISPLLVLDFAYSCFSTIGFVNLPAFHPKPMFVSVDEMGLL
jgi:hypothetical protein